jgi:beta-phosphoglucomutase-like phosphatase (HAD superfamily)
MDIDLVIFDCDGVLVDSEPITTAVWIEALETLGLAWKADEHIARFRGGRMADVIAAAEADLGAPVPAGFVDGFRTRLFERLRREVRPVPRAKMESTLGSTGLLARFEGRIFSAYDVGHFKPDPGLFLHAAAALGARASRCVVVEDSVAGLRAAAAAGMRAFAYEAPGLDLGADGAVPFRDMRALPGLLAHVAASTPEGS